AMHPDTGAGRDRGGADLAAELLPPAQAAEVVDRPDCRRDRGAEQDAAHLAAERQERERRHEAAEEEREPAEARHPARRGAASVLRAIDGAEEARPAADRGPQQ